MVILTNGELLVTDLEWLVNKFQGDTNFFFKDTRNVFIIVLKS